MYVSVHMFGEENLGKNLDFEFLIDLSVNCIFIKHFGLYDFETNIARGKAVSEHEDFRPGLNRLVVALDCESVMTLDDIRRIIDLIKKDSSKRGNYREAIYVDNMLGFGLSRMFDSMKQHKGAEYRIFHNDSDNSLPLIKDWLSLEPDFEIPSFLNVS